MADDKARLEKIITELRIENADLRGALMAIGATPMISDEAMESEYGGAGWEEILRLQTIANDALRGDLAPRGVYAESGLPVLAVTYKRIPRSLQLLD